MLWVASNQEALDDTNLLLGYYLRFSSITSNLRNSLLKMKIFAYQTVVHLLYCQMGLAMVKFPIWWRLAFATPQKPLMSPEIARCIIYSYSPERQYVGEQVPDYSDHTLYPPVYGSGPGISRPYPKVLNMSHTALVLIWYSPYLIGHTATSTF